MKIVVDNQTFNSKKEALNFFSQAIAGTDGSEKDRMYFAYQSIKDGMTSINTYEETATCEENNSFDKLMKKVNKADIKFLIPIFRNWAQNGNRTLIEVTGSYISTRFGVSTELAQEVAAEII